MHLLCADNLNVLKTMSRNVQKSREKLVGVEGFEPPTVGLEIRCSILLSYTPFVVIADDRAFGKH